MKYFIKLPPVESCPSVLVILLIELELPGLDKTCLLVLSVVFFISTTNLPLLHNSIVSGYRQAAGKEEEQAYPHILLLMDSFNVSNTINRKTRPYNCILHSTLRNDSNRYLDKSRFALQVNSILHYVNYVIKSCTLISSFFLIFNKHKGRF